MVVESSAITDYSSIRDDKKLSELMFIFFVHKRDGAVVQCFKTRYGYVSITREVLEKVKVIAYPLTCEAIEALQDINLYSGIKSPGVKITPLFPHECQEYQIYKTKMKIAFGVDVIDHEFKNQLSCQIDGYNIIHESIDIIYPTPDKKKYAGFLNAETGECRRF